ncbi:hypothetical protein CsSME_00049128 [Camellia sinensis var. sinensis]
MKQRRFGHGWSSTAMEESVCPASMEVECFKCVSVHQVCIRQPVEVEVESKEFWRLSVWFFSVSVQQSRCSSPAEEVVSEVECPTMVVLDGWSSTVMEPECPAILVVECPTMAQGARVRRGAQECLSV